MSGFVGKAPLDVIDPIGRHLVLLVEAPENPLYEKVAGLLLHSVESPVSERDDAAGTDQTKRRGLASSGAPAARRRICGRDDEVLAFVAVNDGWFGTIRG
jgi:hypothetical protein